mmetsp:Transcript_19735/g.35055  ORF Transcript_19735/g.35055 Transcript_19735/m.35055 type:complete len:191 (+) Transcript_19735:58-630(+)|eukprot:CAMPEP_0197637624 /NCGR_PEP_ID=MMETSP1338-20131121/12792_1 /TAXON_ID=43686 ORGANISM="Pelagodinium beii, Strain RCC1491" /NCGR_SAMPLE_ID=MMETSP1338 /ASSEMBLY_ACC=CAM_ASM_000754 /LENGTH=190 /DNA_ID=CAMNT_0043210063 /DNA_START=48 /DNA_END=620 /DNA_ORIENTATION=-
MATSYSGRGFAARRPNSLPSLLPAADAARAHITPAFMNGDPRAARQAGETLRTVHPAIVASDFIRGNMEARESSVLDFHNKTQQILPLATRPGYSSVPRLPGIKSLPPPQVLPPPTGRALGACAGTRPLQPALRSQPCYLPPWVSRSEWGLVQGMAENAHGISKPSRPGWILQAQAEGRHRLPMPDLLSV